MSFTLRNIGGSKFGGGGVPSYTQEDDVCGVWGSEGKVYISTNDSKQLIVTDAVPRSRWAERYATIVESNLAQIVAVFQNPRCPSQVYVVFNNSITNCIAHINNQWINKHSFQLSNAKGAEILSIAYHPHTSMFFWCERRGANLGEASCCVCMREVPEDWDTVDFVTCIGPVIAVVQCCPMMSLYLINKGVCMVPNLPDEQKQLLFFWTFVPRSLKVYVWNHTVVSSVDKTDFKAIVMHLLPIWNSFTLPDNENIISLTTHPTTLELLILDNTYTLSYACIHDDECCIQRLSKLNLQQNTKKQTVRNLFAFGLFVGIVFESGLLEIMESRSGLPIYTITELEDSNLHVWTYGGVVNSVGVWSDKGIWELKPKSISDIARVMQNLSSETEESKTTIKEENQTENDSITCGKCLPGYEPHAIGPMSYKETIAGSVAATQFLQAWNQLSFAAKVTLNTVVLKMICNDSENFKAVIEREHMEVLLGSSFQSPVAALALFYHHPCYKENVVLAAKLFLEKFESNQDEFEENTTKTVLNDSLYPYMKHLITLTEKFDNLIETQKLSPSMESDVELSKAEVKQIFHNLNLGNPDSQSLSRVSYLQQHGSLEEVFESMSQKMGLGGEGKLVKHERWRKIFRLEWKDGRWQRNHAALDNSNNPSLSLLCSLLYNQEPDWLLKVYDNGMTIVNAKDTDERAKDHITQTIADSLPTLVVDPSPKSVYAHAVLLWTAGQEIQAMQVILRHRMWSQALDFLSSLPEDTNSRVVLFIMMLKTFLNCGAPNEVLLKALSLVPQGFSTNELLLLFQDNGSRCNEPFVGDNHSLTIGDVRKRLNDMFTQ